MDLNKLGFAVGLLALLLAVPLAVIANLITPKVRDWYSTTSLKRLKKRLSELKEKLTTSEAMWTFSPSDWEIYKAGFVRTQISFTGFSGLIYLVGGVSGQFVSFYRASGGTLRLRMLPIADRAFITLSFVMGGVALTIVAMSFHYVASQYWDKFYMHSDEGREKLRTEIKKLSKIEARLQ